MAETQSEILVSIIVPVFRVEKELPRCMESLLRQTEKRIEVILVDDGSDDGCPALCDQYAAADDRVRVIHKPNGGLSDARNAGMAVMRGTWCLFVDSDDYIDDDACERLLAAAAALADIDIVVGECVEHRSEGTALQQHTNLCEGKTYTATEYIKLAIPRGEFYMPACLNLYRSAWLSRHQLEFAKGLLHEDMEWSPRVFLADPRIAYAKGPFYHYVIREGSICKSPNTSKNADDSMMIYRSWREMFSKIDDAELQKLLYAFLCKCFIHTCALFQEEDGFKKSGLSRKFLFCKSRGIRAKCMAGLMSMSPSWYYWLYKRQSSR